MRKRAKSSSLGNVAIPWDANTALEALTKVNGTSFRFVNGDITSYGFTYGTKKLSLEDKGIQDFLAALLAVLVKWELDDLLGVCAIPDINGPIGTEFTSGNANITLPVDLNPNAGSIEAMWCFSRAIDMKNSFPLGLHSAAPVAFGQCKLRCKLGANGHQTNHLSNT